MKKPSCYLVIEMECGCSSRKEVEDCMLTKTTSHNLTSGSVEMYQLECPECKFVLNLTRQQYKLVRQRIREAYDQNG